MERGLCIVECLEEEMVEFVLKRIVLVKFERSGGRVVGRTNMQALGVSPSFTPPATAPQSMERPEALHWTVMISRRRRTS